MMTGLVHPAPLSATQPASGSVRVSTPLNSPVVVMREWLDFNRCEPSRFDCGRNGTEVVLFVGFSAGVAAEGFARRFGGEMIDH